MNNIETTYFEIAELCISNMALPNKFAQARAKGMYEALEIIRAHHQQLPAANLQNLRSLAKCSEPETMIDYGDDIKNLARALEDLVFAIEKRPGELKCRETKKSFMTTADYKNAKETHNHYADKFSHTIKLS